MKKYLLLILTLVLSTNLYSQITFEPGYFIDDSGKRTDCLIKNLDWKNNPTKFSYKLTPDSEPKKAFIESVKEFGINNTSKYVKRTVNIDRSSENINNIKYDATPIYNKETLFLKVLVEGEANLYQYKDTGITKYFYKRGNSAIEQLMYKLYIENNKIGRNKSYIGQLWKNVKCSTFSIDMTKDLEYKKKDLVDYFVKFNECSNADYTNFDKKQKRDLFNLNLRPGFNISNLAIKNANSTTRNVDFGNQFAFRFGIEGEMILPYNRNKWAIIAEPTFQYYSSKTNNAEVKYQSIELPLGLRYYIFLNDKSKFFVNGSFVFDFTRKNTIDFEVAESLNIFSRHNVALGIGYKHNDLYSVEIRYQSPRELLSDYVYWNSYYETYSIIFGYSIFKSKSK